MPSTMPGTEELNKSYLLLVVKLIVASPVNNRSFRNIAFIHRKLGREIKWENPDCNLLHSNIASWQGTMRKGRHGLNQWFSTCVKILSMKNIDFFYNKNINYKIYKLCIFARASKILMNFLIFKKEMRGKPIFIQLKSGGQQQHWNLGFVMKSKEEGNLSVDVLTLGLDLSTTLQCTERTIHPVFLVWYKLRMQGSLNKLM